MAIFLFILLVVVSLAMIGWGFARRERILQYPTLAGAAWLLFMAPQALGVLRNPTSVPDMALADGGLEMALGMSVLCAAMGWLGYMLPWGRKGSGFFNAVHYSGRRTLQASLALLAVGLVGFHKLAGLTGGWVSLFSTEGSYALEWRGLPVAYTFFAWALFPALYLLLVSALAGRNWIGWVAAAVGSLPVLATVIFLGRRSQAIFFILIVLLALLFARGWAPPRSVAVAGMLAMATAIVVAPEYRSHSQIGADWGEMRYINPQGMVHSVVGGEGYSEFQFAVVQLAATNRFKEFGLGRGFYNTLVRYWVPRLLVGDEVKESLFVEAPDCGMQTYAAYQWSPGYGSNPTGINDAFCEFWFFGALLYLAIGVGFRHLWDRAFETRSVGATLFYTCVSPLAMTTVVGNLSGLPADLLYVSLFVVPAILFARAPRRGAGHLGVSQIGRLGAVRAPRQRPAGTAPE
jgi:hypothetical protein